MQSRVLNLWQRLLGANPLTYLNAKTPSVYLTKLITGSHLSSLNTGVIWSNFCFLVVIPQAKFCYSLVCFPWWPNINILLYVLVLCVCLLYITSYFVPYDSSSTNCLDHSSLLWRYWLSGGVWHLQTTDYRLHTGDLRP